jgi:hypothetical protein
MLFMSATASAADMEGNNVCFTMLSGYITEKIVAPPGKCRLTDITFPAMNMTGCYSLTIANMNQDILYKTPDDDVIWSDEASVRVKVNIDISPEESLMGLVMFIPDDTMTSFCVPVSPGEADDEIGYNDLFAYPLISAPGYTLFSPIWEQGKNCIVCPPPAFVKGNDQEVNEDAPTQTVPAWTVDIKPAGNDVQTLRFEVTTNKDNLFAEKPEIDAVTGNLTYMPAPDVSGIASVTVTLTGQGSGKCTGENVSDPQQFIIRVNSVNDPPVFTKGRDLLARSDAGLQTVSGWASNISAGPSNESYQNLSFLVTTDNDALFSKLPAIDVGTGDLSYTPKENACGTATVSVTLKDDGGVENNGIDVSSPQTFNIAVGIPGDADNSGALDLGDAVNILQMLTGANPKNICSGADVNADRKIGIEEAIFILRRLIMPE